MAESKENINKIIADAEDILDLSRKKFLGKTDAVKSDNFDRMTYEDASADVDDLIGMENELIEIGPAFGNIVRDVWLLFFMANPVIRDVDEMNINFIKNHLVSTLISENFSFDRVAKNTVHDSYSASFATISLKDVIKDILEQQLESEQQAAEMMQQLQDLINQMQEAIQQEMAELAAALGKSIQELIAEIEELHGKMAEEAKESGEGFVLALMEALETTATTIRNEKGELIRWGESDGDIKKMSYEERKAIAQKLQQPKIKAWSNYVGRFRQVLRSKEAKNIVDAKESFYDVENSGDITRFMSQELLKSTDEFLEVEFLQKLAEGEVPSHSFIGRASAGNGTIVACLDTSGSMGCADTTGVTREQFGKAMLLSLYDRAQRRKRDFSGILFSSRNQVQSFSFPRNKKKILEAVQMIELNFDGGTDFETPLKKAMEIVINDYESTRRKADIVFMTDGDCHISDDFLKWFLAEKAKIGFRVFSVIIGNDVDHSPALTAISEDIQKINSFFDPKVFSGTYGKL